MDVLPIVSTFLIILVAEIGDKTQLITLTLAAERPPVAVLIGLTMAFALLTGAAVLLGAKFVSKLPMKWLKIGTSALFIAIGSLSILSAALGISFL